MIAARHLAATQTPADNNLLFSTVENVVAVLGQFATDSVVTQHIERISSEFVEALGYPDANSGGHPLAESTYTETVRLSEATASIMLSRRFLTVAPTVTEDGVAVDPAEIEADYAAGIVRRLAADGALSAFRASKIEFAYTAGFIMPPETGAVSAPSRRLPRVLERAVIDLLHFRALQSGCDDVPLPIKQDTLVGEWSAAYAIEQRKTINGVPEDIDQVIERYRFPVVGWA